MEASVTQNISGGVITGIYNHDLPLNPQCTAFCDYNGALRLFLAPSVISDYKEDIKWMECFINRTLKGVSVNQTYLIISLTFLTIINEEFDSPL